MGSGLLKSLFRCIRGSACGRTSMTGRWHPLYLVLVDAMPVLLRQTPPTCCLSMYYSVHGSFHGVPFHRSRFCSLSKDETQIFTLVVIVLECWTSTFWPIGGAKQTKNKITGSISRATLLMWQEKQTSFHGEDITVTSHKEIRSATVKTKRVKVSHCCLSPLHRSWCTLHILKGRKST